MGHKFAINRFYKRLQAKPLTHEEKMEVRNTYRRKVVRVQKEKAYKDYCRVPVISTGELLYEGADCFVAIEEGELV